MRKGLVLMVIDLPLRYRLVGMVDLLLLSFKTIEPDKISTAPVAVAVLSADYWT